MADVAFSVSRPEAISENGKEFCHSVNGCSVATTPAIAKSMVPKVWLLLGDRLVADLERGHAHSSALRC